MQLHVPVPGTINFNPQGVWIQGTGKGEGEQERSGALSPASGRHRFSTGEGERTVDHKTISQDQELCLRLLHGLEQDSCHLCALLPPGRGKEVGWLLSFPVPWGHPSAPGILAMASLLHHARTGKGRNQVVDVPGGPDSLRTPLLFIPK